MHFLQFCADLSKYSKSIKAIYTYVPSNFSSLTVSKFIFVFESGQNLFSCGLSIGPSWSVKYLNFGLKLPIRTAHNTFLESGHPEIAKIPYYVLSPRGEPKKYHLTN